MEVHSRDPKQREWPHNGPEHEGPGTGGPTGYPPNGLGMELSTYTSNGSFTKDALDAEGSLSRNRLGVDSSL